MKPGDALCLLLLLPGSGVFIYIGLSAYQKILPILQDTSQMLPISSRKTSSEPLEPDKMFL